MRRFTWLFTFLSAALCLFHYLGFDPRNVLLFSLSIPLWFVPIFADIKSVNLFIVYAITIGSYALIGYAADRFLQSYRFRRGIRGGGHYP